MEERTTSGPRHAILDLAPLELECMNALWPLGEGSVREVLLGLGNSRQRAYTTIMTIMDRLAHKGIVTRRKVGRAYHYRPSLTAEQARRDAIAKVVEGFFDGSPDALAAHLASPGGTARLSIVSIMPRAEMRTEMAAAQFVDAAPEADVFAPARLDETLL